MKIMETLKEPFPFLLLIHPLSSIHKFLYFLHTDDDCHFFFFFVNKHSIFGASREILLKEQEEATLMKFCGSPVTHACEKPKKSFFLTSSRRI